MVFYGVVLPPFESDDYVDLDVTAELEYKLEGIGCRIIEIGKQPFVKHALAITKTITDREDEDFVPLKIENPELTEWDSMLDEALTLLGIGEFAGRYNTYLLC